MSRLKQLIAVVVFAAGMLAGLQVPGFVDQYLKRIESHAIEARVQFAAFQKIADEMFSGDYDALIKKHEDSSDETFHAEAKPIRACRDRMLAFESELTAMRALGLPQRVWHMALSGQRDIIVETWHAFTAVAVLEPTALTCGAVAGGVCYLLWLVLWSMLSIKIGGTSRPSDVIQRRKEAFERKYMRGKNRA